MSEKNPEIQTAVDLCAHKMGELNEALRDRIFEIGGDFSGLVVATSHRVDVDGVIYSDKRVSLIACADDE